MFKLTQSIALSIFAASVNAQPTTTPTPSLQEQLDVLCQSKNQKEAIKLCSPELLKQNSLQFLIWSSPYGTSPAKWRANSLTLKGLPERFIVFTNKASTEDIGDQVFIEKDGKLTNWIAESDHLGLDANSLESIVTLHPETSTVDYNFSLNVVRQAKISFPYCIIRTGTESKVTSLKVSGKALDFSQAGSVILVHLPSNLQKKSQFKFEMIANANYSIKGAQGSLDKEQVMLADTFWWAHIGRNPMTLKTTINAPSSWRLHSTGTLISEKMNGGTKTSVFKLHIPVCYFAISGGAMKYREDQIGKWKFWMASMEATDKVMAMQNQMNARVIEFYNTLYPWPFTSWGVVESKYFQGGALESYSYGNYQLNWLPDLEAHEPSHTFWGGVIPNTYLKSMWNEAFATFSENYIFRNQAGNSADLDIAFREIGSTRWRESTLTCWNGGAESGGVSGYQIGYQRGGKVLSMIEQSIGKAEFRKFLMHFLKSRAGKRTEWEDVHQALREVVGNKADDIVNQYLKTPKLIAMKILSAQKSPSQNLKIAVSGLPTERNVIVEVGCFEGEKLLEVRPIRMTGKEGGVIRFSANPKTTHVVLDPYLRLLRNATSDELDSSVGPTIARGTWFVLGQTDEYIAKLPRKGVKKATTWSEAGDGQVIVGSFSNPEFKLAFQTAMPDAEITNQMVKYHGQVVNLTTGSAMAKGISANGKACFLMVGNIEYPPTTGFAYEGIMDSMGVLMAGKSGLKRSSTASILQLIP